MTEVAITPIRDAMYLSEMCNSLRMSMNNIQNLAMGVAMIPKFRERYEEDLQKLTEHAREIWEKIANDLQPIVKVCEDKIGDIVFIELPEAKE
jgi:hypothetical protein